MAFHRISTEKRAMALNLLCEGNTVNGVCRLLKIGKPNLLRFILETAEACEDWHDKHFRNLTIARLELDEQWHWVHTHKERMTREQKMDNPGRGDAWLWVALDPESKAAINWQTGKRSKRAAGAFADDLASRIEGRVQITSDKLES